MTLLWQVSLLIHTIFLIVGYLGIFDYFFNDKILNNTWGFAAYWVALALILLSGVICNVFADKTESRQRASKFLFIAYSVDIVIFSAAWIYMLAIM